MFCTTSVFIEKLCIYNFHRFANASTMLLFFHREVDGCIRWLHSSGGEAVDPASMFHDGVANVIYHLLFGSEFRYEYVKIYIATALITIDKIQEKCVWDVYILVVFMVTNWRIGDMTLRVLKEWIYLAKTHPNVKTTVHYQWIRRVTYTIKFV